MTTRVPRLPPRLPSRPRSTQEPAPSIARPLPSKLGPIAAPDRRIATAPEPSARQGDAETRTFIQTYFTKVSVDETQILYNGDRQWAMVTVVLETSGPVVIGTVQKITPVNSGKGILLNTDVPVTIKIAKGTRLYVASTSVSRLKVTVEAVPWLEQITGLLRNFTGRVFGR